MADVNGGGLSFKATLDNDQLTAAIEETVKRVQGLSDAVASGGDMVDSTFSEMAESIVLQQKVIKELEESYRTLNSQINAMEPGDAQNQLIQQAAAVKQELDAEKQGLVALRTEFKSLQSITGSASTSLEQIRATLSQIGDACYEQEEAIAALEAQYKQLSTQAGNAWTAGRNEEYRAISEQVTALQGEITVRQRVLKELREQSNALEEQATAIEKEVNWARELANSHVSLNIQLREVREEMQRMELAGDTTSEAYKKLQERMKTLSSAISNVQAQQNKFRSSTQMFDGLLSGISGVTGAFTAAQGAMALFGSENEDLQKIMLKVQSLMAITIGLKQTQAALDKNSAFQLTTLNSLREWWNKILAAGTKGQVANTVATKAGTTANIGLAGAFRMVGAAIKSIPGFGWIAAGLTALVAVISKFVSKANESKKAAQEFYSSLADNAYKPIAKIEELSLKWNALGDDLNAKTKFINENAAAFDELGVAVNDVADAQNLLVTNKEAFVQAQVEKAKALLYYQQAQDKVRELVEKQQAYEAAGDDTIQKSYVNSFGGVTTYTEENKAKKRLEQEIQQLNEDIKELYNNAAAADSESLKKLEEAGIEAIGSYEEGTLGALQQAIQRKQESLKYLTNSADYQAAMKEIEELQRQVEAITGKSSTSSSTSKSKDPFLEQLEKYKSEYQRFQKWINSGDEVIAQAAQEEFAKLLSEGATYLDYLKNQRDQILAIDEADRTGAQNSRLTKLNDAIADETRETVLEQFNNELDAQLSNARNVIEMLDIIEQRRSELSGDGTELDLAKAASLDSAEESAREQLKQETAALLEEYASYTEQKRRLEQQFNDDVALMMRQREQASSEEEAAEIDAAIQKRTRQYDRDLLNVGGIDYNAMLSEYGNFEQKKLAITQEYAEKRREAEEAGYTDMIEGINKAEAQALSSLALSELQASPDWELMFGNLDELTTKKLKQLIENFNNLEGVYLGVEFDAKDLETIKQKIQEMQDEISSRNPFAALVESIKEYSDAVDDAAKKKALTNSLKNTEEVISLLGGMLDAVVQGIEDMGIEMDESTEAILNDVSNILDASSQIASGLASGDWLSVIQGGINLITSAFSLFNSRNRQANAAIAEHEDALEDLQTAYTKLAKAVDDALGTDYYSASTALIKNLEAQKAELEAMMSEEESKKRADSDVLDDYQQQIDEIDDSINDVWDTLAEDILQTNALDFASDLADALVEAFEAGESAAEAFEDTVNNVLKNAIVNQLKKQFLEAQLQSALDDLYDKMGYYDDDGNFIFDGLTDDEVEDFKNKVQAATDNFTNALEIYKDILPELFGDSDSSLTGAVKGITEETADIIAGQMNAIRINQLESAEVLRQSLQALNTIAANTTYNRLLSDILTTLKSMQGTSAGSLRSKGLTA